MLIIFVYSGSSDCYIPRFVGIYLCWNLIWLLTMIQVDIKSLRPGIHEFEWKPTAEELELDPDVFRALHVGARLDFHPSRIFVTLETSALARMVCDRTLVEFDEEVDGEHSVLFSGADMLEDGMEEDDDIRELKSGDEEIDLTGVVRDTFILSIPARKIAPGAESTDIQLAYGAPESGEPAVDPRWEALRKLSSMGQESEDQE